MTRRLGQERMDGGALATSPPRPMEYKVDMSGCSPRTTRCAGTWCRSGGSAGRRNGNPATRPHAVLGWELFKKLLISHHQAAAAHEESDGLPLIDASLPPPDWQGLNLWGTPGEQTAGQ